MAVLAQVIAIAAARRMRIVWFLARARIAQVQFASQEESWPDGSQLFPPGLSKVADSRDCMLELDR